MCLIVVQISQWWSLWFLKPLETELVAQMIEHQERVDGTLFAPDLGCVAPWMLEECTSLLRLPQQNARNASVASAT